MKILYVSHYKENSGSGRAAREYMAALREVGHEVVPVSIDLSKSFGSVIPYSGTLEGCEVIIQHIVPQMMEYRGEYKMNIGIKIEETHNTRFSKYYHYYDLMDQIWFPNNDKFELASDVVEESRCGKQRVIPHCTDLSIYSREWPKPKFNDATPYRFYTICEYHRRKNLPDLLKAYLSTFTQNDNVSLVIKVHSFSKPQDVLKQELVKMHEEICAGLKIYGSSDRYPSVQFITEYLTEAQIFGLHQSCNCFVSTSFGEAWCYPTMDACLFGKAVISNTPSARRLNAYPGGTLTINEPCFANFDAYPDYGTGKETWERMDICKVSSLMKFAYKSNLYDDPLRLSEKVSRKYIGKLMEKEIDAFIKNR